MIVSESTSLYLYVKNKIDVFTSKIKVNLIIMPFEIGGTELDDECRYYL